MPSNVTALMKTAVRVATLLPSRQADSSPSVAIFRENVVMNAVESAPSANKSRNRFGNRNAIRKASRFLPAPKSPAKTCSRINPSRREHMTATPTTPVARVLTRWGCAAGIGEQRTTSANLRKQKVHNRNPWASEGRQRPVGKFKNSHSKLKRSERCVARALTPNVSVA